MKFAVMTIAEKPTELTVWAVCPTHQVTMQEIDLLSHRKGCRYTRVALVPDHVVLKKGQKLLKKNLRLIENQDLNMLVRMQPNQGVAVEELY